MAWGGVVDGAACAMAAVIAAAKSNDASKFLTVCMDISGCSIEVGKFELRHSG
jgi:hypothetical protein